MKVECNIDGKALSLSVNSNKPLSLILMEDLGNLSLASHCQGRACGNCIVLLNDEATLSCLVPAFRIRDANIKTFERYQRSAQYRDIERAYKALGSAPCSNCYNAKTLIIESILNQIIGDGKPRNTPLVAKDEPLDNEAIIQELRLSPCQCIGMAELLQIVELALTHRQRRRRVRRR